MSLLQTVVAFLVALGILIVVHEYGHYLAARLCGVKVLRFSVGFGRPLVMRRRGADQTEWVLAAIPFGGYVKMLDEREGPVAPEEAGRAFNRQGVWRRILIVAAGPLFNFLFAIAVYAGLYMYGMPEARPVLAAPAAGTPALVAGLKSGDTVRAIGGEVIVTWQDLRWRVMQGALQREALHLEVEAENGVRSVQVLDLREFPADQVEGDLLERLGMRLYLPALPPVIGRVVKGGAAEKAGLRAGDRVVEAAGEPVTRWEQVVNAVRLRPGQVLPLLIERDGARLRVDVAPESVQEAGKAIGRIGAGAQPPGDADRIVVRVSHDPLTAVSRAAARTWDISVFSLRMLGKMVVGEVSLKHLSGPVTIADYAGQSAQLGWLPYATFLALISISLGVLNLLPIPLLDGGHLMYYFVEIIKGRPVSERAMELGQRVGLALLLVIMAFAFYNDLNRLFSG